MTPCRLLPLVALLLVTIWPLNPTVAQEEEADSVHISAHEWFTEPWRPLKGQENIFDLSGALLISTGLGINFPGSAADSPAAFEATGHLRLEPRFIINGPFTIRGRFDLLGTAAYGPDGQKTGWYTPAPLAIGVERLWMELGFFNQRALLAIGRVPRHWGLGIWQNSGNGPEATHGGGLDQVQLLLKLGSILLLPSIDFISSGPNRHYYGSQPIDLDNVDDAWGITLEVGLLDSPEDLAELMRRNETVWNFSTAVFYRQQARFWSGTQDDGTLTRTDGRMAGLDFWLGFYRPYFRLEFEGLFYWHRFTTTEYGQVSGVPFALALEWAYWPGNHQTRRPSDIDEGHEQHEQRLNHRLGIKLKTGLASGDRNQGFATINNNIYQAADDQHIQSFVFHPDYFVDRILFRRILGSVSESFYLRPEIDFLILPQLLASVAMTYSCAVYGTSTPGGRSPLGTEFEFRFSWHTKNMQGVAGLEEHQPFLNFAKRDNNFNGLQVALNYNFLVPLSGLNGYLDKTVHLLELSFLVTF